PTYLVLYLERVHGTWELPWWLVAAEYGAVPAAAVVGLRFARVPDRTLEFGAASRSGGRTSAARRRVWSRWRGGRGGRARSPSGRALRSRPWVAGGLLGC